MKYLVLFIGLASFSAQAFDERRVEECNNKLKRCVGAIVLKQLSRYAPKEFKELMRSVRQITAPKFDLNGYGTLRLNFLHRAELIRWTYDL